MKAAAASTVSCAAIRGVHVRAAVVAVSAVMGSGRSRCAIGGAMLLPPFTLPLPYALRQRVHQNLRFNTPSGSGTNQAGDRGGGFGQLVVGVVAALGHGAGDAVAEVLVEQIQRHRTQGAVRRADLGEDVDAIFVFIDHAGDSANLALDAAQPLGVIVLLLRISVCSRHVHCKPPRDSGSGSLPHTPKGYR